MRTKNSSFNWKKHRVLIVLGVMVLVLGLFLGQSILNLGHNKKEKYLLKKQTARLDTEYEQLADTLEKLKQHDPALLEQIARTQYDLAKPNEIEFRFPAQ